LFGKRSETKDANDRYANVQTSYLLQKMEEYDGTVILASNFLQNFDEAFRRRIKFIVEFPLPDRERREQIWRSVMPRELPMEEDIDFDFLARSFELSGSSIKNIVVSAAFLAAAEAVPMGMVQLLLATQSEQHKTGKNIGREEFGEYFHQVQSYLNLKTGQE
ncbi:MAG: ATP-binding protein, partial [Oscillospiraceae bacterium]